ncbi:FkbM family methyltransferase [Paludisphaera rhizosphaerae]|uniref:FkbM family methyltransferase n=1 Tax=Paludisphaera rhizosphaerae TaxID=2711216 RepID=UPI0013EA872E|nr:FkbM family methyltransferase [Paludisphaera rhizosphaerae]
MQFIHQIIRPWIRHELPGWGKLYSRFIEGPRYRERWGEEGRRIIRGKLHGYTMELDLGQWSDRLTYFLGRFYDQEMQLLAIGVLQPGDRFVDVGANVGMVSLLAASRVGATGLVDSVEPNPTCVERLRSAVDRNHISHLHVHPCAAADVETEMTLFIPKFSGEEASLAAFDVAENDDRYERVCVKVRPVEAMLAHDPRPPILVKIDVEGYECSAVRGMADMLRQARPLVATEIAADHLGRAGCTPADLISLMKSLGYTGWTIGSQRAGIEREFNLTTIDPSATFYNALWIPTGGPGLARFNESFPDLARRIGTVPPVPADSFARPRTSPQGSVSQLN